MQKFDHENKILRHALASARFEVSRVINFNFKIISFCRLSGAEVVCAKGTFTNDVTRFFFTF